nr:hypothetical protein [Tanacetum cinerariifolium]
MNTQSTFKNPSKKRFLFDKRYGYVYDEWRQPSEVALAYGRGMFCIVPLGKALFTMVTDSKSESRVNTFRFKYFDGSIEISNRIKLRLRIENMFLLL